MKRVATGAALGVMAALGLAASGALASSHAKAKTTPVATVAVNLGRPVQWDVDLSQTKLPSGNVVFKVTNDGSLLYSFELCNGGGFANVCVGQSTPQLNPGQSVLLNVSRKKGNYEYILTADNYVSTKGTVTVEASGVPVVIPPVSKTTTHPTTTTTPSKTTTPTTTPTTPTAPKTSTSPTSTSPTPTGPSGPVEVLIGDPSVGAGLFQSEGCGSCHTLAAAGSTGVVGPNLNQVQPDQPTVVTNVTYGNAMGMPAFGGAPYNLSTSQIDDLAAYVYASTCNCSPPGG